MNVGIIGLGLMGSSMALAIKDNISYAEIYGSDINIENLKYCINNNIIDKELTTDKIKKQDVIFIAVPVRSIVKVIAKIEPNLNNDKTVITDMGSTKSEIVNIVKNKYPDINFIGGHPMTGREISGPGAALVSLFLNKNYILTKKISDDSILKQILTKIGTRIITVTPKKHDELVAFSSHIPQFIATTVINYLIDIEEYHPDASQFIGQGFRDFTRIAASDPRMWQDIFITNKDQILTHIEQLQNKIESFKKIIENQEEEKIYQIMESGKMRRIKLDK